MEFNEKRALEIIDKYGLSLKTLKTWKSRGNIPGKYFDKKYTGTNKPVCNKTEIRQLKDILTIDFIVEIKFSIPYIFDYKAEKYKPKKAVFIQVQKEVKELKRKFQSYVNTPTHNNLSIILKDDRISNSLLFADAGKEIQKMIDRLRKGYNTHTPAELDQISTYLKLKMSLL